jgi:hypothetical protein
MPITQPIAGVFTTAARPAPSLHQVTELTEVARELEHLEWEAGATAAILDLVSRLNESYDLKSGSRALAAGLARHLQSGQVAIGIRKANGVCRLVALSSLAEFDPRSELARHAEAALNESLVHDAPLVLPVEKDDRRPALAHQQLLKTTGATAIFSAPLRTSDGTVGAWLFLGEKDWLANPRRRRFIEAAERPVAAGLDSLRRGERIVRLGRRWCSARPWLTRKYITIAAAVVLAILCLPLHYKVGCDCELQPVVRRYVAAPHAGVFEKSLVKPGDLVAHDQVLGRMDGREVRWELAGIEAEQSRAGKSRDVNMATSKVAAAQIDRLEMERLEQKRQLMTHRLEHLEIKSPLDGIVLTGDLERSEGVSLTVGQTLYEVAPLEQMLVEVAIADDEITHVRPGMDVTIRLDAFPGQSWTGRLERVHPRSEIRDEANVFIGEVSLDNRDHTLRPGMKGRAKIAADRHTLAWIVLHEPVEWVLGWVW